VRIVVVGDALGWWGAVAEQLCVTDTVEETLDGDDIGGGGGGVGNSGGGGDGGGSDGGGTSDFLDASGSIVIGRLSHRAASQTVATVCIASAIVLVAFFCVF
jgi:hypothetical protein